MKSAIRFTMKWLSIMTLLVMVTGAAQAQFAATVADANAVGPTPPIYNTIEAAVANTNSGGTVTVMAGSYTPAAAITLSLPVSILGPQDGVDPRTAAGLRTAGGGSEAIVDGGANANVFIIAADNVTIAGLDIVSSAGSGAAVTTSNAATRQNAIVRFNFVRRTGGTSVYGILIDNANNADIIFNNVRSFPGGEPGAIGLLNADNTDILSNETFNTSGDPSNAIGVGTSSDNTTIRYNLISGTVGKYGIGLGYSAASPKPIGAICTDNVVTDFDQAGISVQMASATIEGNEISMSSGTSSIDRAAIYIRDAVCQDVTVQYNYVHDVELASSSRNATLRVFAWVNGEDDTILVRSNAVVNSTGGSSCGSPEVGFAKTDSSQNATFDIRNNWWGDSSGPSTPPGGCSISAGQLTDLCNSSYLTLNSGAGHALGKHGSGTTNYCWYPWAMFRGVRTPVTATGGTRTFGINFADNDLYFSHSVTLPDLTADDILHFWSPDLRMTEAQVTMINNAVEISLVNGATFAPSQQATVVVQYDEASDLLSQPENTMTLARWNGSAWVKVDGFSLDTVGNTVSAQVDSFSVFGAVPAAFTLADPPTLDSIALSDPDGTDNADSSLYSNSATVTVTFGTIGGDAPTTITLAQDAGFTQNVVEVAYASQLSEPYTLTAGDGSRTVFAKLGNSGGDSTPVSDDILLDSAAPSSGATGAIVQAGNIIEVAYTANDGGSGMQFVRLFYQKDGGGYSQYAGTFTASPISFDATGTGSGAYDFYTVAVDNSGNAESKAASAEASAAITLGQRDWQRHE